MGGMAGLVGLAIAGRVRGEQARTFCAAVAHQTRMERVARRQHWRDFEEELAIDIRLIQAMIELHPHALDLFAVTDNFLVQFNDFQCGIKTALHYAAMNGAINIGLLAVRWNRCRSARK